jgi:hypothetical protein
MPSLISKTQTAFVQCRQFFDGVLIANEVIDGTIRLKRKAIHFKVDFEKACNSVDQEVLHSVMDKVSFPTKWRI